MLKPSRLALTTDSSGNLYKLQAQLESLIGKHLEGRIQAGLVTGRVRDSGVVLGYYEAYRDGARWRRITGGASGYLNGNSSYLGLVFASESLGEVADVALRLSQCVRGSVWGVTRIGPRQLAAGVVEVFGDFTPRDAISCVAEHLFGDELRVESVELGDVSRIEFAYRGKGWLEYTGAGVLPFKGVSRSGDYWVLVGLAITSDGFISNARIEGVFHAAPPNEPYNLISAVLGMPAQQAYDLLLARIGLLELYGITGENILEAFRGAIRSAGLDYE